jgi:subtilisin family serine protease
MLSRLSVWLWLFVAALGLASSSAADDEALALPRREHFDRLGVTDWHRLGHTGKGIKIAILDTGFRGWRQFLGRGLPEQVVARSFRADGDLEARESEHGILCGEIIHALAPAAELLFANWDTDEPATFVQAVRWAKERGARVLTCSVIMPSWSDGEGGGSVHAALDPLIGDDLLFFASAGNIAQRHWTGTLRPDARGWHQWAGAATGNTLAPWSKDRVAVELYGPFVGASALNVIDRDSGVIVGESAVSRVQDDRATWGQAVVRFDPEPQRQYQIHLKCVAGAKSDSQSRFHLAVLGANLEYGQASGSVAFPADGARVLAVGAVDRRGQRAPYSACGPNSRLPKPDLVAVVPFPSECRARPFSGTSAAAPQAAALAALYWSRRPEASAADVSAALKAAAFDLGPPGHDSETGYGLVRLP